MPRSMRPARWRNFVREATPQSLSRLQPAFSRIVLERQQFCGFSGFTLIEWIARRLELDTQWRADQLEMLAHPAFQKALVSLGYMLQAGAMNDNDRRVLAALVGIAHLGTEHARALGLLKLHGLQQQACEHRGGHLRLAEAWAWMMDFQTGARPWRLMAEIR